LGITILTNWDALGKKFMEKFQHIDYAQKVDISNSFLDVRV
jgi:hypothetical protein